MVSLMHWSNASELIFKACEAISRYAAKGFRFYLFWLHLKIAMDVHLKTLIQISTAIFLSINEYTRHVLATLL